MYTHKIDSIGYNGQVHAMLAACLDQRNGTFRNISNLVGPPFKSITDQFGDR